MNERAILKKIEPINSLLESRFGVRVEIGTFEHLVDVRNLYESKRKVFLATLGESAAMQNPDYAKAVLISEAVHLLLKEIAPKRIRKRK
ncbi:MAG: hypothetical protein EOP83_27940 [Verrucomicrobiaceae bacterium]|nr:MAG: hypothetical protein EOP83_27940 [Verrucomicrobiaceae bacterium]